MMPGKKTAVGRTAGKSVWKVFFDTETGSYIACQPSVQPSFTASKENQLRYAEVASFQNESYAKDYAHTKNLGKPADILDYVLLEHDIMEQGRPLTKEEAIQLDQLIQSVQEATGRKCFGKCSTMNGRTACKTCYTNRNATWRLCANISVLEKLKKLISTRQAKRKF